MELSIIPFDGLPCHCKLTINGRDADQSDFGTGYNIGVPDDEANGECYGGCEDFTFEIHSVIPDGVLTRYGITEDEWYMVASELGRVLSVGSCNECN